MPLADTVKKFTYADYSEWPEDERWELIDGIPYNMSPAPSRIHQRISWELGYQIRHYLGSSDSGCQGFAAPFDVRFPRGESDDKIIDVVQPDIVVICDDSILDDRGCLGPPDFVVEILSKSTASKDSITKLQLYEKNGIREYWIIDPAHELITVRVLGTNGKYGDANIYDGKTDVPVSVLPGLSIDFSSMFG